MKRCSISLLLCALALTACPAGRGEGWVMGSVFVGNCKEGAELDADDDFDLEADFFAGDPLFDNSHASSARSRLFIRLQQTSNPVAESDSLALQFQDLTVAAEAFAGGRVLPISDDSLVAGQNSVNSALRMRMQLYTRCPDNKTPLSAVGWPLSKAATPGGTGPEQCMVPTSPLPSPPQPDCPTLTDAQRAELKKICAEPDFNDRGSRARIEAILGSGAEPACLYLCKLGGIERGTDPERLQGYTFDYNETISALFVSKLVDARAIKLGRCAQGWGRISGRFRFTLVRSRVAQPFP